MKIKQLIKELQKYDENSEVTCISVNAANEWCRKQIEGIRKSDYRCNSDDKLCKRVDIIYEWS